ncbi:MarR family transcriptional regulator [Vagococcus sp. DIV0080]|uniref:MarR family transcriptional regulator n=1 Tax=Candidatus Vagococcus giribetii TaxID=2230876 RepID=A0ABS3HTV5_9ENTE|nr:MarR family transcriptional regulator [Vagococcus sp. DIV0080]MBO0477188.1 MarR family transcriptional regulator [Vagococcus sp. DIV0080]
MDLRETSKLLYQLKLANQEMMTKFEEQTGFSITRYELMQVLRENAPCSQSLIQTALKIDSAAVTRHLKILEEKNYVTRERNKENNREVMVTITDSALQSLETCDAKHKAEKKFDLGLTEQEEKTLLELLTNLV